MSPTDRKLLLELFGTAVTAADPGSALLSALESGPGPGSRRVWILALGKAAPSLAEAAVEWLRARDIEPAGGIIVAHVATDPPHPVLTAVTGDHPLPGPSSIRAAESIEEVVRRIRPSDEVWVLLSGGTTSLIAAPIRGISADDLYRTYAVMLGSGLDIGDMNRVRKRISRWGGGRLAVALAHTTLRVYALSDVAGDDIASIGSGPCSPDPTTAVRLRALLGTEGLLDRLPHALTDLLDRTERRMVPETPKPGEPAFRNVSEVVIASNRMAVDAAAAAAEQAGLPVRRKRRPLRGDAAECGDRIARRILQDILTRRPSDEALADAAACYLCGGETTVTVGESAGRGGRCQELALAAARAIDRADGVHVTLLAAGTDGRDGPTDAAGAIVDNETWSMILAAGRDPGQDLEGHDAYAALDAAGALVRTGATRTNVNDVVIAIARRSSSEA